MASTALAARTTTTQTPIPMATRIHIELRKLVDTRSSLGLLALTCGLTLLVIGLTGVFDGRDADLRTLINEGSAPLVFLLPIVAILAIVGEWRHRTALFTYAFDPRRSRVLTAKLIALVILTLGVVVLAVGTSLLVLVVLGAPMPGARETIEVTGALLWSIGGMTLVGAALGAALLSAPLALAVLLLLPQIVPQLLGTWTLTAPAAPYVDVCATFLGGMSGRGAAEAPAVVSAIVLWIVVPLAVGFVRNARRDV